MKVLVTGSTGFIGINLVRFLHEKGISVQILCRKTSDIRALKDLSIRIVQGDILDYPSVRKAVSGCDSIFHLAGYAKNWARDSKIFFDVNVGGTKNILAAALEAGVKKVVITSTCMTFGPSAEAAKKECDSREESFFCAYERAKTDCENLACEYVDSGLPVVTVNPTRVFGPGLLNEANSVTKMIDKYIQGKWRLILSNGKAVGNYAYVDDVVLGHWQALERGRGGEKYILGGENITYNDFFKILAEASHRNYRMIHVPYGLAMAFAAFQDWMGKWFHLYPMITPDWVRVFVSDWAFSSEKAKKEIGYKITPFREALNRTLVWLNQGEGK